MVRESKPIRLLDLYLDDTLPFLSRWELDVVLMVSHQFGASYYRGAPFRQRRIVDLYARRGRNYNNLSVKKAHQLCLKIGISRCIESHLSQGSSVTLLDEHLQSLLQKEPDMRAHYSIMWPHRVVPEKIRRMWEGFTLEIDATSPNHPTMEFPAENALFAGCSSLIMGCSESTRVTTIHWPTLVLQLGGPSQMALSCARVQLDVYNCLGINFAEILDFLFTPPPDGWEKREFSLECLRVPEGATQQYTPARLKSLLEQRLANTQQSLPCFSLKLVLRYSYKSQVKQSLGEFELLNHDEHSNAEGTSSTRTSLSKACKHSCRFVAGRSSVWDFAASEYTIQVACS